MLMADKIIVQKAKRKLYLERNGKVIFEFPVQLGKNPVGPKQSEGDGRTPEGFYYIDYNVNRDPANYRGFYILYPNEKD
jgi:murein L,D-transpeptidase YafK